MKTTPMMVALVVTLAAVSAGVSAGAVASQSTDSAPLGASISSFMQASVAEAGGTVDSGLYAAKLEGSNESERARLIQERIETLNQRVAKLQEEREAFDPAADGNVTVSERAQAARLAVRATTLLSAINETEATARQAGIPVNETNLDLLRSEARNMTGQQVATVATGLVDIDRPAQARGGPNNSGNRSDNANRNSSNSDNNSGDGKPDDPGQSGDAPSGGSGGSDGGGDNPGGGNNSNTNQSDAPSGNDVTTAEPGTPAGTPAEGSN